MVGEQRLQPLPPPSAQALETFVAQLTSSGVMSIAEVEAFSASLASDKRPTDAAGLARELVERGKLTRYQAAAVFQGKVRGLVFGDYVVLERIGAGGMGQVYKARHRRMDRVVALKVLPAAAMKSPAAVQRFQREVQTAARLNHPNIVAAFDAGEQEGTHYLVMEFVDGSDLSNLIKSGGPLGIKQAVDCLQQAARALEHAHSQGVIHRDVKPSNLLMDKRGTVKILDMGLAIVSDLAGAAPLGASTGANVETAAALTQQGTIMGTVDFMAPEQAVDTHKADARSDLYGLGCTLHYLLTGRAPYGGDTLMKRLLAHRDAPIPALRTLRPEVPAALANMFERLMAKRPEERFQTASELLAALTTLNQAAASSAAAARPLPIAPQQCARTATGQPNKSSSRQLAFKVGAALACIAGLLTAYWMSKASLRSDPSGPSQVAQAALTPGVAAAEEKPKPAKIDVAPAVPVPSQPPPVEEHTPAALPPALVVQQSPQNSPPPATADAPAPDRPAPTPPAAITLAAAESPPNQPAEPSADAPVASTEPMRLPVPDAAALAKADALVKDVYRDDLEAAKTAGAKLALAEKLLQQAGQTPDDHAGRYAMLCRVRDLAVEAASPALAARAIQPLAESFDVDSNEELADALGKMVAKSSTTAASKEIADAALVAADEAVAGEQWDQAKRMSDVAMAAARKAKDSTLTKQALDKAKSSAAGKQQWDSAQAAKLALAKNPDDPAANLALGSYLCFVQEDWSSGFACLAKSSDERLKELAAKSRAAPEELAAQVSVADAWWDAAEKAKGKDKADLLAGAGYWYRLAADGLIGLNKIRAEKRLAEIDGAARSPGAAAVAKKSSAVGRRGAAPPEPGAVAAGGHFYKVYLEKIAWSDAKAKCEQAGGTLVCIGSGEENEFIINLIEAQIGKGNLGTTDKKFWLGGHLQNGEWRWITGEPFDYAPNKLAVNPDSPCLRHAGRNWLAINDRSGLVAGYVCEWNPAAKNPAAKSTTSKVPGKSASTAAAALAPANGLAMPQLLDLATKMEPATVAPTFNVSQSWTLAMDVFPVNIEKGRHHVFYYGENRIISLYIYGTSLSASTYDAKEKNKGTSVSTTLHDSDVGKWHQVVLRYDATSSELSLYLNGGLAEKKRLDFTPQGSGPMVTEIGGVPNGRERFTGQVRNIWLGNQDNFILPGTNPQK